LGTRAFAHRGKGKGFGQRSGWGAGQGLGSGARTGESYSRQPPSTDRIGRRASPVPLTSCAARGHSESASPG